MSCCDDPGQQSPECVLVSARPVLGGQIVVEVHGRPVVIRAGDRDVAVSRGAAISCRRYLEITGTCHWPSES
jgi:hypothetical protein